MTNGASSARASNEHAAAHPVTDGCRFCWMCRHVCPVGHVTHNETLTPHGWALTIDAVARGTLEWNADTADVLYSCADCGLCRTHCVTDQALPDAIAAARAIVAARGTAPEAVYALHEKLERWGNPYQSPLAEPTLEDRRDDARDGADGPDAERSEADRSATDRGAADRAAATTEARGDLALFVGDAAAYRDPRGLEAALTLLKAAGLTPVEIGAGRSTGLLASTLGFPDTAAAHASAVLADVTAAGCTTLLVLSAGDRYAFQRLYRERLGIEWPAEVAVTEVTSVLAEAVAQGRLKLRRRSDVPPYAYQDADQAPRVGRDHAAPRALLRAALGDGEVRLFWREQRAHPSGAVGGLEFTQPAIANRLTDARLADATAAGAAWLITEDPGSVHHLRSRPSPGVEVHNLYELLAAQLEA